MASTYSTSLKIQLMGNGEDSGTWGSITNTNWNLMEQAVAGVQTITMSNANYTLSDLNGVSDEARNMVLVVTGTNSAIYQVIAPLAPKFYVITNSTVGGYAITIGGSSGAVITVPSGTTVQVYCDGTNFFSAQTSSAGNFNVNGNLNVVGTFNYVPAGVIQMWPTTSAPAGFLLCAGAAISRTTYAALFAVIGTTFGVGDGSTTFNLPNYVNRMPYGASIGVTGGSADAIVVAHTHTGGTSTVDINHTHNGTTGGQSESHYHNMNSSTGSGWFGQSTGGGAPQAGFTGGYGVTFVEPFTQYASNDHTHSFTSGYMNQNNTHSHTFTTNSSGSSGTNANLPPYLGIAFIIKT